MRTVIFCINPLFPSQTMGGATKHLKNIALYLGERGHEVTILCTRRADSYEPFRWSERVQVLPILRFHQPFPGPYATPAHHLAAMVQDMGEFLARADRFYMHDGEFLFPFVYRHIPTVVSLRDVVYPETLLGSFLFAGDVLVMISNYARDHYLQTSGRFFPQLAERIRVIHNGINWAQFRPTPPQAISDIIPVDPRHDTLILHPHRPEPTKGIFQTIAVVDKLVHRYGWRQIKALVPKWLDIALSGEVAAFYQQIADEIKARDIQANVIFHDWIPQTLMPQYFSMGALTLALGNFVETFGNTVYESLGCGTPAIAARISTHRELLPDGLLDKVDYDDVDTAADIANDILRTRRRTSAETLDYLHTHYSVERQLAAYAETIENARVAEPLAYTFRPLTPQTRWRLAVWCYLAPRGIYHDFRGDYLAAPDLIRLTNCYPDGWTALAAAQQGIAEAQIEAWYRDGYIVPL